MFSTSCGITLQKKNEVHIIHNYVLLQGGIGMLMFVFCTKKNGFEGENGIQNVKFPIMSHLTLG